MAKKEVSEKEVAQLKRLEEKRAKIEAQLKKKLAQIKEKERKRQSRTLIENGRLVELAGLDEADRGFLLGGLLELSKTQEDKDAFQRLKRKGDAVLKEREDAGKAGKK